MFLLIWHLGATYLFNKEADRKIEKAFTDQGEFTATQMEDCISSGDVSCQPNTLPFPAQVLGAYKALLRGHKIISEKKEVFAKKTEKINARRAEKGESSIKYTGRPSFVDQIKTSIKTVFARWVFTSRFYRYPNRCHHRLELNTQNFV